MNLWVIVDFKLLMLKKFELEIDYSKLLVTNVGHVPCDRKEGQFSQKHQSMNICKWMKNKRGTKIFCGTTIIRRKARTPTLAPTSTRSFTILGEVFTCLLYRARYLGD